MTEESVSLWLLPMDFTVRELRDDELLIEVSEDPEDLMFILRSGDTTTLVCPSVLAEEDQAGYGRWRALLICSQPGASLGETVAALVEALDGSRAGGFFVSRWSQSYLVVPTLSLHEARQVLADAGYPVFAPLDGARGKESDGIG